MTVTASNYARKENDLYQTEPWATEALLRRFPVNGQIIWEPSAGNHLMADVLKESGAIVMTSDIVTYDRPHEAIIDFLKTPEIEPMYVFDGIITNPPYGKQNRDAVKYTELALQRCSGLVALLLTAKFDFGSTRHHLFRDNPRFTAKINLVDRISWEGNGKGGTEDHAWYVWTAQRPMYAPVIFYEGRNPVKVQPLAADFAKMGELLL